MLAIIIYYNYEIDKKYSGSIEIDKIITKHLTLPVNVRRLICVNYLLLHPFIFNNGIVWSSPTYDRKSHLQQQEGL